MPDIRVHVHTADGRTESIEAPAGISAEEFLRDLVGALKLPHAKWVILGKNANLELDPKETLEGNGVQAGDHLYLAEARVTAPAPEPTETPPPPRQEMIQCPKCGGENAATNRFCAVCGASLTLSPPGVKLHVHTPDGRTHSIEVSVDLDVGELLIELTKAGIISNRDPQGRPVRWAIADKDAHRELRQGTNLKEYGVRPGHHLYLTEEHVAAPPPKLAEPAPPPPLPPPNRKWVKVVIGALLLVVIIGVIFYLYRPKPKAVPHPPPHPPVPRPGPKGRRSDVHPLLRQMQSLEASANGDSGWPSPSFIRQPAGLRKGAASPRAAKELSPGSGFGRKRNRSWPRDRGREGAFMARLKPGPFIPMRTYCLRLA